MSKSKTKRQDTGKYLSKAASLATTLAVVTMAGVAVWQGSTVIADRANAVAPPRPSEPLLVRTAVIEEQDHYTVERSFVGQIEAPQTVSIAFEGAGTVSSIRFDEGQLVKEGQVLATLDDRLLKADLERLEASKQALEAQRELAILTDQRQSQLREKGFTSNQSADQSRLSVIELGARIAEAEAAILSAKIRLEKAAIRAPFSGRVDRRLIDPGTTVGNGQGVLEIVEDDAPVFRVGVDPRLANKLDVGDSIDVVVNDVPVAAEIIAILPKIDPITRTRTVRAVLQEQVTMAFGQTGRLMVKEQVQQSGAWIPLNSIEDGVRGLWTIKTANGDDEATVGVEAIEILYAEEERTFVRGTFGNGTRYILHGLHRVAPGQVVRTEN